ncbi:hypothetical protein NMY22_g3648 [Coprinellus aureogranulatus]|nr:hypothetical protein NMY22_g3648 [Coprinellus aureogranulatus]
MVFVTDPPAPKPIAFADGSIASPVLEASQKSKATWLPVQGDLFPVLLELAHSPGASLFKVEETGDAFSRSFYVARAGHQGSYHLGLCAFHLSGARIRVFGRELVATQYDVLVGSPEDFQWRIVRVGLRPSSIGESVPVGGYIVNNLTQVEPLVLTRYRSDRGWVYGEMDSAGEFRSFQGGRENDYLAGIEEYEVLVIPKPKPSPVPVPARAPEPAPPAYVPAPAPAPVPAPPPEVRVRAAVGRFFPNNHWQHVKRGDRYSTVVTYPQPFTSAPKIILGFDHLDASEDWKWLRARLVTQNITRETFMCVQETWHGTSLFNAGETWAAIDEPGWQTGVRKIHHTDRVLSDTRVNFTPQFSSLPMVFVCFSGFDMGGRWDFRVAATSIDHSGFSISFSKPMDTKVGEFSVSWVAISGTDILQRKNAWIGRFSTDTGAGNGGHWSGHTNFGFNFKRKPEIFMGVDHLSFDNSRNVRLKTAVSNVSTSGMDWTIDTWHDSICRSAGVSYLAIDSV